MDYFTFFVLFIHHAFSSNACQARSESKVRASRSSCTFDLPLYLLDADLLSRLLIIVKVLVLAENIPLELRA